MKATKYFLTNAEKFEVDPYRVAVAGNSNSSLYAWKQRIKTINNINKNWNTSCKQGPTRSQNLLDEDVIYRYSTEFGKRSFSYLAATVWNDLPLVTRLPTITDTFKHPLCIAYQCCPPSDCWCFRFSVTADFCTSYKLLYYYNNNYYYFFIIFLIIIIFIVIVIVIVIIIFFAPASTKPQAKN